MTVVAPDPHEIVARLWPGRKAAVEPLGGGITNQNFKVTIEGAAYVLRIGGQDTELLGIDRTVEHGASRVAAEAGIGPKVVKFVEPEGYLVTRFIDGAPVPPDRRFRAASTRSGSSRRIELRRKRTASRSPSSTSQQRPWRTRSRLSAATSGSRPATTTS